MTFYLLEYQAAKICQKCNIKWHGKDSGCTILKNCTSSSINNFFIKDPTCQFGCGILKMMGPKMQDICPRINMLKGFFLKQSCNELWFVKKCQNCTFKVNFLCQNQQNFFQKKKNHLRISI